jgi:MFS family permease
MALLEVKKEHSQQFESPWPKILILAAVGLCNSLATMTSIPFHSQMIMDFGLVDRRSETGYYAGFINSASFLGRVLTASAWGFAADRFGRKPVITFMMATV